MPQLSSFIRVVLGCSLLHGCAYQPASFAHSGETFHGARATVGCMDLAIERRSARVDGNTVVAYAFGNRCDQPAVVDLASVRIIGRTASGVAVPLIANDPRAEIRPMLIDGRAIGREAIAYAHTAAIGSLCVDAASITHMTPARWLCFSSD